MATRSKKKRSRGSGRGGSKGGALSGLRSGFRRAARGGRGRDRTLVWIFWALLGLLALLIAFSFIRP
ncbi:MAG: hypothetical protein EA398_09365 [Deltaproteobacteria bacterium]|nr:MAG: hypothetical protein EA398_09365 [Deltaproteobacteria bacterium]